MNVIVYHASYGCGCGCCGHVVEVDGKQHFEFTHPDGVPDSDEDGRREWARRLVADTVGEKYVEHLDWKNSEVFDDC